MTGFEWNGQNADDLFSEGIIVLLIVGVAIGLLAALITLPVLLFRWLHKRQ